MTFLAEFPSLATASVALPRRPLHLAIGMFDGVHLGHCAVIGAAVESARRAGGLAAVLTFWPHPSALFRPTEPVRLLMDAPARTRTLLAHGADAVITEPFTPEFARVTAENFLPHLRRELPALAALYVGENFRFGQGRRGDVPQLVAAARAVGLAVFSAPRVNFNGEPVSSSRLRVTLAEGRLAEVNAMLGRAYTADGIVAPGKQLGRTLGFPTLNLNWTPAARPRLGVYALRVGSQNDGASLPAVANYGLRPTVEAAALEPVLEIHVVGDCPFTTGDALTTEWLHFLRPEQKFANVEELRAQVARDRAAAAEFFRR
jgi:riboflavin kinase/FMN adenylyltransferase